MRILHCESSTNWGGQEYRILEQMQWLAERGHAVALAARDEGEIALRARSHGHRVFGAPFRGHFNPGAALSARRIVRAHGAEVADCHGSRDAAALAFARTLVPVIRTRHIAQPLKAKPRRRAQWRWGCDHVIVTAGCIRDGIVDGRLVPADRVTVVGEWAADAFFEVGRRAAHRASVRREFSIPEDHPVVSVIGMLRDDKAQEHLIGVAAEMRRRGRAITGLIVGSAPRGQETYERRLHDLARGLADGDVVFTGYREDVPRIAQASDALMVTSMIEAQSRTVPQAFAAATPVVASRVGGIGELVTAGETGWLVEAGDIAGYADALTEILARPDRVREVTARARAFAEHHLKMAGKMAETLAVYETAIRNRHNRKGRKGL